MWYYGSGFISIPGMSHKRWEFGSVGRVLHINPVQIVERVLIVYWINRSSRSPSQNLTQRISFSQSELSMYKILYVSGIWLKLSNFPCWWQHKKSDAGFTVIYKYNTGEFYEYPLKHPEKPHTHISVHYIYVTTLVLHFEGSILSLGDKSKLSQSK